MGRNFWGHGDLGLTRKTGRTRREKKDIRIKTEGPNPTRGAELVPKSLTARVPGGFAIAL